MNVAVVAGEASGDIQAANLLKELSDQMAGVEEIRAWGIGGSRLRESGCELIADSSTWGTISITESAAKAFTVLAAMHKFKRLFPIRRPDLLILVDFGAFNIPLANWVKKQSATTGPYPIFYYFPPSSWRRKINLNKLRRLTSVSDLIVTPFSWSADLLQSAGGNAYFLGHPLLDTVKSTLKGEDFDKIYGLDRTRTVITLLPGSREHEVKHILPVLLASAGEIARRLPGVQFLVAKSPNLSRGLIEEILRSAQQQGSSASLLHLAQQAGDLLKQASSALKPPIGERVASLATPEGVLVRPDNRDGKQREWAENRMTTPTHTAPLAIVENGTLDAMSRSDLVITASGTATLEAAILGCPTIIVYRGSALMNAEYLLRRKALNITYIGLPNILAGDLVCPEFLQDDANSHAIANQALEMLLQPEKLLQVKKRLKDVVRDNLGEPGATKRTAAKLLEFVRGECRPAPSVSPEANI